MKCFRLILICLILTSCQNKNQLILKENTLGELQLKAKENIETLDLKRQGYICTDKIAAQDGPDYLQKRCSSEDKALFSISTYSLEDRRINRIEIISKDIRDEYGVQIGTSFDALKNLRPKLSIQVIHSKIYALIEGSHIYYILKIRDYKGPDLNQYTDEQLKDAQVVSMIWS